MMKNSNLTKNFLIVAATSGIALSLAHAIETPVQIALPTYNIRMALTLNGNLVTTPTVIAKSGEISTITHESNGEKIIIEVAAKDVRKNKQLGKIANMDKVINMAFTIKRIDLNGNETILARPKVTALENEEAQITATEDNGESYSFNVTADRL
jgi:type II secretory pathway component GspD/PulD (secretin)